MYSNLNGTKRPIQCPELELSVLSEMNFISFHDPCLKVTHMSICTTVSMIRWRKEVNYCRLTQYV